jgi:hypothetical protein
LGSGIVLVDLSTNPNGGIVLGGKSGAINLFIHYSVTAAMQWDIGVYDLLMISPDGRKYRLVMGEVECSEGVTE